MDYFSRLPLEITLEILCRVPAEYAINCKSVSTSWRDLVRRPSFWNMHLHRLNNSGKMGFFASTSKNFSEYDNEKYKYFEYDENHSSTTPIERIRRVNLKTPFTDITTYPGSVCTSIVGSVNGLICFARRPSICICNPITREQITLPEIKTKYHGLQYYSWTSGFTQYCVWTCGFGYISSTNEYKVVVVYVSREPKFVEIYVYTLGSRNGWRNLGKSDFGFSIDGLKQGIFANEALYWMGSGSEMIFTFDLAEERFCEHLSPPPLPPQGNWYKSSIGVLDGLLYFAAYQPAEEDDIFQIWLLEKKNGMKEREQHRSLGWTKKFSLKENTLLAVTKSDGVLTYMPGCLNICDPKAFTSSDGVLTYIPGCLNICDPKSFTSKRLVHLKEWIHEMFPHKNTLVSLKELGEKDTEIMKSIELQKTERRGSSLEQLKEVEALVTSVSSIEIGGRGGRKL